MDRINGAGTIDIGTGRRGFRDEDLVLGQEGTEVKALWLNMTQEEILYVVESTGMDPSPDDWSQLAKAIQSSRMNFAAAGGSATALTLALSPAPVSYASGLIIRFKAAADCAGATTINVDGLGAVPLTRQGGGALARFDYKAGDKIAAIYDAGSFQLLSPAMTQFLSSSPGTTTIFVRTDGNDNNDGSANTAAAAFATINAAASYALRRFNTGAQSTVIQLGNAGNYDGCTIGGIANLILRGDPAAPQNYVVGGSQINAIRLDYCPGFRVEGIKIRNGITTDITSNGLLVGVGSSGLLKNCELDPVVYHLGFAHIGILDGGSFRGGAPSNSCARHRSVLMSLWAEYFRGPRSPTPRRYRWDLASTKKHF
ncbi:hypothetical protein D4A92_00305 [Rhizobium rosettiformans]|uniref:Uncharacterized protein n=1 Tax=Rhizobium rosettiformans TaxID=1368430 RepID=A0ABX7ENU1_9HYPH|nr:hypothetical protein [Rhizobium rosettiformans]QRF49994.1 hypothetical protein D4A92_00305 [Rhizobium rosettiformans]